MMYGWGHMYNWGNTAYGWNSGLGIGGIFMALAMVAFWALIIVGIVYAIRALSGRGLVTSQPGEGGYLDILKERYARGEIDTEEYESRKRQLVR